MAKQGAMHKKTSSARRQPSRTRKKPKKNRLVRILVIVLVLVMVGLGGYHIIRKNVLYPLSYGAQIERYAAEFSVDPYLVTAIMHTESHFDPEAVSSSGALGLMQIMPETGVWIAKHLDDKEFDAENLNDPNVNIRYGCWYLSFLCDRYNNDLASVAAAYNAGQGAVDDWLNDPSCSNDGKMLSHIPSSVTNHYVNKVREAYETYQKLYENAYEDR